MDCYYCDNRRLHGLSGLCKEHEAEKAGKPIVLPVHKCSVRGCGHHIYYKHHCMAHLTDLEKHELQGTRELAIAGRY
jgi:hypothetical protein